jgi:hypothetical protein
VSGIVDRPRYGAVGDGSHTHHSRGYESRANDGLAAVDLWERTVLAGIDLRIAALSEPPEPHSPPADADTPPTDPREHVRWAARMRRAAVADATHRAALVRHEADEDERRVLLSQHVSVRLYAAEVREKWAAWYAQVTPVYSRYRISHRGFRPAPQSTLPTFTPLSRDFRDLTGSTGEHTISVPFGPEAGAPSGLDERGN